MRGRQVATGPTAEPGRVVLAAGGALAFSLVAALWVPWDWVPGGSPAPVFASSLFGPDQLDRMDAYSSAGRTTGLLSLAVSLVVTLGLALTPVGSGLVRRLGRRWWLQVLLGAAALVLIGRLVTLPFAWHQHRLALDYGLTTQDTGPWLVDQAKGLLVSWVTAVLVLLTVVGLARWRPTTWHRWAAGVAAALVAAGSFLYPVLVEPLFNHFEPMPAGHLRSSILRLASQEHVGVDQVLVADASRRTTTLNAYVSGFGDTRRVVVYDTTLRALSDRQVLEVVAHELGHARHHDVVLGTALGALGAIAGIGLLAGVLDLGWVRRWSRTTGAADPGAIAVVLAAVAVGSLLVSPVQNTVSRAIEARADRNALQAFDTPADTRAFVAMQRHLALRSLSDPAPPRWDQWWFGSHPTVLQRVGIARAVAGRRP